MEITDIKNTHFKTQMQTPTVKQQYLWATMRMTNRPIVPELTDAQTLFNNENNNCTDRTHTNYQNENK